MDDVYPPKSRKKGPTKEEVRERAHTKLRSQLDGEIKVARNRRSTYTPDLCEMVIAFGMTGRSLPAFAGEIMTPLSTIMLWQATNPEFAEAIRTYRAIRINTLERELLASSCGPKVMARLAALKNLNPEDWRDRKEYSIGGSDDMPPVKQETNLTPSQAYLRALRKEREE